MPVHIDNMSVENKDFYDGEENLQIDEEVEDNSMDVDLDENPAPAGPPSSAYSPEEESILIKLKLGSCSMQEVETCKEQLRKEQWNPSEDLPEGWMYKRFGENLKLLGRGGELFENMNEAFEFVEKYQAYFSRDDLMKVFAFGEDKSSVSTPDQKDFTTQEADDTEEETKAEEEDIGSLEEEVKLELKEEDSSLPEGWIVIQSANRHKVKSPEGKWFQGKRSALKYLIELKYPEDKIQEFRLCLHSDGWKNNPALPVGWLFRIRKNVFKYLCREKTKNGNYFLRCCI